MSSSCLLQVGLVYMFNLIVGTGALTMPRAFATAGWVVSLALITFLGFMRYSSAAPHVEMAVKPETNIELKHKHKWEPVLSLTIKLHMHTS